MAYRLNFNQRHNITKALLNYNATRPEEEQDDIFPLQHLLQRVLNHQPFPCDTPINLWDSELELITKAGFDVSQLKETHTDFEGIRLFPIYANRKNLRKACEALIKNIEDAIGFIEMDHLRKLDEHEHFLLTLAMMHYPYTEDGEPEHWDIETKLHHLLCEHTHLYEARDHSTIKEDLKPYIERRKSK